MITPADLVFLKRTLALARNGKKQTRPNPLVGAVIVKDNIVIAEGYHHYLGGAHAEIDALNKIAGNAREATLYVNLEPCSHYGRTPPCVDRIIAEGITRVVFCTLDANPVVRGNGYRLLREQGIQVEYGCLEQESFKLNRNYFKYVCTKQPWILLKAGASLDGKIATVAGESKWITSEKSRADAHRLRDEADAILVGVGTILADDPFLTVRRKGLLSTRQPAIAILDTTLRTPATAAVFSVPERDVLIFSEHPEEQKNYESLLKAGALIISVPRDEHGLSLKDVMNVLASRAITSVLVEGGGAVHFSMIRDKLADELVLYIAPIILGGQQARSVFGGTGFLHLREAPRIQRTQIRRIGADLRISGFFYNQWLNELPFPFNKSDEHTT